MPGDNTIGRRAILRHAGSLSIAGAILARPAQGQSEADDPYRRGVALLERLGDTDTRLAQSYSNLSADLARLNVRMAHGEILSRPGLDLRQRMIVNIAATATLANVLDEVGRQITGALEIGMAPREIVEVLIQLGPEVGFPVAQDALFLARDIFRQRDLSVDLNRRNRPEGDTRDLGFATLAAIGMPEHADDMGGLGEIGIDLDRLTADFVYGEIYNRPGLDRASRSLVCLTAMVARGNRGDALAARIDMARRSGVTVTQMSELLIQMTIHAGWSETLSAAAIFQDVLSRQPRPSESANLNPARLSRQDEAEKERLAERGLDTLMTLTGLGRDGARELFADIAPDVGDYFVDFSYAAVFSRPGLDLKTRELATVSAMVALGTGVSELPLRLHVIGSLKAGATRTEISETIFHMLPYVGFPAVRHALVIASGVFAETTE
jgi:4-carboxymuconolactone decarboxylase